MATDPDDVYERIQDLYDLEDLDDTTIDSALLENFTNRKTKSGKRVDLTSDHQRKEWRDSTHKGKPRYRDVKGFTPNLSGLASDIKKIRDDKVKDEIAKITKPLSIASIERGEADKILDDREKELKKWKNVRDDVDKLIEEHVTSYREGLKASFDSQIEAEEENIEEIDTEIEELESQKEELKGAKKDLEKEEQPTRFVDRQIESFELTIEEREEQKKKLRDKIKEMTKKRGRI